MTAATLDEDTARREADLHRRAATSTMVAELFAIDSLPPCEAIHLPWLAEQATGPTIFRSTPLVMRHFNMPLRGCSVRLALSGAPRGAAHAPFLHGT